jgi:3-oxoacyl-[acyl-carrier-protein] synthase I
MGENGMQPVFITAYTAVTACGFGTKALRDALLEQRCCLEPPRLIQPDFQTFTGEISGPLPELSEALKGYNTRNARIALAGLDCEERRFRNAVQDAVARYGSSRVGVIIGTSTSGIYETELAYKNHVEHDVFPEKFDLKLQHAWLATAEYVKRELGLGGACYAISTACSTSGKAVAAGQRFIETGVCDAMVVGGVDSICHMTLYGFNCLELISERPCTPLDRNRDGISIGEGAGLLLLERERKQPGDAALIGYGESSDAYHMTAPHPEGEGSARAMQIALQMAGIEPNQLDYINLHATGTKLNDAAEMQAMATVFSPEIPCSGSKGITGHTLGAAGGIEAVITLIAMDAGFAPGTSGIREVDHAFSSRVLVENLEIPSMRIAMSNNFGFGGNNVSLIFAAGDANGI